MAGDEKKETIASTDEEETKTNENGEEEDSINNGQQEEEPTTSDDSEADIESDREDQAENNNETMIKELKEKITHLEAEYEKTYDRMLRIQAEFDNYKKRTQREKAAERKYRSQDLATQLLPALDNFERALAIEATEETKSILEGISMVYEQIKEALKSEGIEEIEAVGKEFDPNLHHAVMQVEEEDQASNTVVEVLQKGYQLKDRVIRPAMVKVNK